MKYIKLFPNNDGSVYTIEASYWNEIRAAYKNWIERRIDTVLELEGIEGFEILIAASHIGDFFISTPESREKSKELSEMFKKEACPE